jgi:hypothetical protein
MRMGGRAGRRQADFGPCVGPSSASSGRPKAKNAHLTARDNFLRKQIYLKNTIKLFVSIKCCGTSKLAQARAVRPTARWPHPVRHHLQHGWRRFSVNLLPVTTRPFIILIQRNQRGGGGGESLPRMLF